MSCLNELLANAIPAWQERIRTLDRRAAAEEAKPEQPEYAGLKNDPALFSQLVRAADARAFAFTSEANRLRERIRVAQTNGLLALSYAEISEINMGSNLDERNLFAEASRSKRLRILEPEGAAAAAAGIPGSFV
jgi:hypothetical protein